MVEENNLQVQISTLRKVLGEGPGGSPYLMTVPGRGYRFVGQVERVNGTAADTAPPSVQPGQVGAPLALPDKPSIAVLPFTNMSGDPEQEYFADGMAEEIITALSRCSWLFVIARNSSFTYKGRAVDVRQVGRDLGVRYVLEGSVRRGGNRVRFTGQLIEAASGNHIWADRFDGDMSDVFELQDRITENVVAAIEPTMQRAEIERIKQKPSSNLNAYDHLLHAQQLEYEFTETSLEAALQHLRQAIDIDFGYASAMALAAYCHGWRRNQNWSKNEAADSAEGLRLMARALEIEKLDANILWMCAMASWQLGQENSRAMELVSRSLEINPNSSIAWTVSGWMQVYTGHYATGKDMLARAQRLSPRDPRGWYTANGMSMASLGEGNWEDGVAWARRARTQNPAHLGSMRLLAANLAQLGRRDEAGIMVAELLRLQPDMTISKTRAARLHMDEGLWGKFAQGLRLGGLPE